MPDSKENQGNYSMYPVSPVPPAAQMPPGAAAAAAAANSYLYSNPYHSQYNYGYPMGIELYPSQTLQYMGYHQPAMSYGGGYGGPTQAAVPMKKKFYNNGNNNYKKDNQNNGGSSSVGPNVTSSGNSPDGGKPVQVTIKNLFKFELGNSNSVRVDGLKVEYPMYVNTTAEEFAKAKVMRQTMRLEALRDLGSKVDIYSSKKSEKNSKPVTTEVTVGSEMEGTAQNAAFVNKQQNEQNGKIMTSKEEEFKLEGEDKPSVFNDATAIRDEHQPLPQKKKDDQNSASQKNEDKRSETPVKAMKSWSQVASSAIQKVRFPTPVPSLKKERKYAPSNMKGYEPVGSVALRMCLDKDYTKFVNENSPESSKAVNKIIPRGILNKGNICFMSSVLQVFLFCKPFMSMLNVVYARTAEKSANTLPPLLEACFEFYKAFDKQNYEKERVDPQAQQGNAKPVKATPITPVSEPIDPEPFYKCISKLAMFRDLQWGHQEDAEEFLTHFLDQLHEEFISTVNSLTSNEVLTLLQSIADEDLRIDFLKSLPKYKRAEFMKNMCPELKALVDKYGNNIDNEGKSENGENSEWHEVSKKGKKIKNAVKRTMEVEPSPIMSIFGGEYRSVLDIPQNKESHSITLDPFYTLHLHISDHEVRDLESAFKKFSDFEYLPYKADSGNDVEAKKQAFIDRLPSVLLIQLKRFEFVNNSSERRELVNYNAYNGRIEKIRKWIKYDHELTIPKEAISSVNAKFYSTDLETNYKLTGVVYHHGLSSSGGHYTADVLHQDLDRWYNIDDTNVTEIKKEDVVKGSDEGTDSKTAYILIYQRNE